jgi:hypothetical protein
MKAGDIAFGAFVATMAIIIVLAFGSIAERKVFGNDAHPGLNQKWKCDDELVAFKVRDDNRHSRPILEGYECKAVEK